MNYCDFALELEYAHEKLAKASTDKEIRNIEREIDQRTEEFESDYI